MGFIPPLNLGGFQPSPATLAQWVYQIWQYLQENPIATQEQLQEYIGTFITTSPETQAMIGKGVEEYLTENPPQAPVQSVLGMTGAVQFDGRQIDVNSTQGDTTIAEKFAELETVSAENWTANGISFSVRKVGRLCMLIAQSGTTSSELANNALFTNIPAGYRPLVISYANDTNNYHYSVNTSGDINVYNVQSGIAADTYIRFSCVYITP